MDQLIFAAEVVLNGLMTGVMYALVALGFVLIFKASGVFNYAQGVLALFAALTLVGIQNGQVPFAHLINAAFGTSLHHFGWTVPWWPHWWPSRNTPSRAAPCAPWPTTTRRRCPWASRCASSG